MSFDEALSFCESDPLQPLLSEYFLPKHKILEGGCGLGQYLAYYRQFGSHLTGMDITFKPLRELKRRYDELELLLGTVDRLPFLDETFDVYYSGGVVEHFEQGPDEALREARRVLKQGGAFLVSVPDDSLLRSLIMRGRSYRRHSDACWRRVSAPRLDESDTARGFTFFQYAFSRKEFRSYLETSGFRVLKDFGYSIQWGLIEIDLLQRISSKYLSKSSSPLKKDKENEAGIPNERSAIKKSSWLRHAAKRIFVKEDLSNPLLAILVGLLRATAANMRMFICEKPKTV